jgi:hypothetical protein
MDLKPCTSVVLPVGVGGRIALDSALIASAEGSSPDYSAHVGGCGLRY